MNASYTMSGPFVPATIIPGTGQPPVSLDAGPWLAAPGHTSRALTGELAADDLSDLVAWTGEQQVHLTGKQDADLAAAVVTDTATITFDQDRLVRFAHATRTHRNTRTGAPQLPDDQMDVLSRYDSGTLDATIEVNSGLVEKQSGTTTTRTWSLDTLIYVGDISPWIASLDRDDIVRLYGVGAPAIFDRLIDWACDPANVGPTVAAAATTAAANSRASFQNTVFNIVHADHALVRAAIRELRPADIADPCHERFAQQVAARAADGHLDPPEPDYDELVDLTDHQPSMRWTLTGHARDKAVDLVRRLTHTSKATACRIIDGHRYDLAPVEHHGAIYELFSAFAGHHDTVGVHAVAIAVHAHYPDMLAWTCWADPDVEEPDHPTLRLRYDTTELHAESFCHGWGTARLIHADGSVTTVDTGLPFDGANDPARVARRLRQIIVNA